MSNELDKTTLADLLADADSLERESLFPEAQPRKSEEIVLLERIERNTALLTRMLQPGLPVANARRASIQRTEPPPQVEKAEAEGSGERSARRQPETVQKANRTRPETPARAKAQDRPDRKPETQEPEKPTKTAPGIRAQRQQIDADSERPAPTAKRGSDGRFLSAGEKERQRRNDEKRNSGLIGALKKGIGGLFGDKGEEVKDAAGAGVGGPFYEAAKEIYQATSDLAEKAEDEKGILARVKGFFSRDKGTEEADQEAREETREAKAEKRHKELVEAVQGIEGGDSSGFPSGAGKFIGSAFGRIGKMLAPLGSVLGGAGRAGGKLLGGAGRGIAGLVSAIGGGTLAAGAAAAGAVGSAGYSAVTGKDNIISKAAQALGLVPKISEEGSYEISAKETDADRAEVNRRSLEFTEKINRQRVAQGKKALPYDPITGEVLSRKQVEATAKVERPLKNEAPIAPADAKPQTVKVEGLEELVKDKSRSEKQKPQQFEVRPGGEIVNMEFEDTYLKLMAHDRV